MRNSTLNKSVPSDIVYIGKNTGISAWYRYTKNQTEVYVAGTATDGFAAWTGYNIGYIPYGYRPPMDINVKMGGTFYMEILAKDGTIHVKSEANANAGSFISGHVIYFHD